MIRSTTQNQVIRLSLVASACLAGLLLAGPVVGALGGGDSGDQIFRACYVPGSGVVYLIGNEGLGDSCKGKNHVEFSWNAQGPEGPQGPQGPPGPQGPGLSPQTCPGGEFVTGVDASGVLICSGSGGGGSGTGSTWYLDADSDGWGDPGITTVASERPAGYLATPGDCNDQDPEVHPGAYDSPGDGFDSDCDGFDGTAGTVVDDGGGPSCPEASAGSWFMDMDSDGFGDGAVWLYSEIPVDGYVRNQCDCNDRDERVSPEAEEVVDGKDNNCNEIVY